MVFVPKQSSTALGSRHSVQPLIGFLSLKISNFEDHNLQDQSYCTTIQACGSLLLCFASIPRIGAICIPGDIGPDTCNQHPPFLSFVWPSVQLEFFVSKMYQSEAHFICAFFLTFKVITGIGVSCIATSNSKSGPLAVAGGDQLRVYLHSQGGLF